MENSVRYEDNAGAGSHVGYSFVCTHEHELLKIPEVVAGLYGEVGTFDIHSAGVVKV